MATTEYPGGQQWRDDHAPGHVQPGPDDCIVCGSTPARSATVWLVTGVIVWVQWQKSAGPFCRTCGVAVVRHHTNRTMLTGWWAVFALPFNLFAIAANAVAGRRFAALAPPVPHADVPGAADGPLDQGVPLMRRPGPYVVGDRGGGRVLDRRRHRGQGRPRRQRRDRGQWRSRGNRPQGRRLLRPAGGRLHGGQRAAVQRTARRQLAGIVTHPAPDDAPLPSEEEFIDAARTGCLDSFRDYVGISFQQSKLDMTTVTPAPDGWEAGDRQIQCVVLASRGKLDASVRDSER